MDDDTAVEEVGEVSDAGDISDDYSSQLDEGNEVSEAGTKETEEADSKEINESLNNPEDSSDISSDAKEERTSEKEEASAAGSGKSAAGSGSEAGDGSKEEKGAGEVKETGSADDAKSWFDDKLAKLGDMNTTSQESKPESSPQDVQQKADEVADKADKSIEDADRKKADADKAGDPASAEKQKAEAEKEKGEAEKAKEEAKDLKEKGEKTPGEKKADFDKFGKDFRSNYMKEHGRPPSNDETLKAYEKEKGVDVSKLKGDELRQAAADRAEARTGKEATRDQVSDEIAKMSKNGESKDAVSQNMQNILDRTKDSFAENYLKNHPDASKEEIDKAHKEEALRAFAAYGPYQGYSDSVFGIKKDNIDPSFKDDNTVRMLGSFPDKINATGENGKEYQPSVNHLMNGLMNELAPNDAGKVNKGFWADAASSPGAELLKIFTGNEMEPGVTGTRAANSPQLQREFMENPAQALSNFLDDPGKYVSDASLTAMRSLVP
ncbi:MAG: hypothetical protein RDV48_27430 [Candidatus Eremiobacteraeota bacterium]|nr:hypothetical protein [Candidatus Eremiobacteraeota bacterium]